ncbi:zinc finger protein ZIPIC-like isoform X1 [Haliotis asinina]|uniref:zinc finger protein ZIPIC-like isoform X1 n=1 Tax=Haliotis asinina TaxID=109174 RepID=UPI0035323A7F
MEKQYSVEFFMNFVENIQNLCHNFLEFNQNVEVSGYVCVDIDNMKKERYVLSEIVQMGGNSISESYCTKVFKTSPTGTVQRSGFRDITNARLPNVSPSAGEVDVPGHSYSLQRMRTGPPRKGEISHTLSLNRTASPRSQTKTAVGQNYGDYQSHSGISNSNNTFGNPTARGIQGHEPGSESQIRTKARSLTTKLCRTSTVPESSVLKRQHEHSPLSDSADDTDVIVVKQEPGDEEQEESGDQPPIKRRSETFRLPSSLTGVDQAFVPTPIINQPHPVPISSTTDAEDKSYLPSFSKDSRDSTYDDDTKTVLSEEEIKNLEEYEVELVHSDGEEEEESLDLTFQVPHTGGATQSSVPGAQDSGNFPSSHLNHEHTNTTDKKLHTKPEQGMVHDDLTGCTDRYQAGVAVLHSSKTQLSGIVYSCDQCYQTFTSICDLKTHALKLHQNMYVCQWCGKQLKSSHGYKLHCNSHAGDYRYICPICDKRFQQSSHLEGHINTHNSVRPFKCPTCCKGFSYRFSMTKHAKTCRIGVNESCLE